MSGTFKKIKQGDFDLTFTELLILFSRIKDFKNSERLYRILMKKLINNIDDLTLIECIYDIKCLDKYTQYLVNRNINKIDELPLYVLEYLILNTNYFKNIFLDKIDDIFINQINLLACFYKNEQLCLDMFNSLKNKKNKLAFLTSALERFKIACFSEKDILNTLCQKPIENNMVDINRLKFMPNDIGSLLLENNINSSYRLIAEKYSRNFFESQKESKIKFLYLLQNDSNNLKEKYRIALDLYVKSGCSNKTDSSLSNLINYGNYDEFSEKIRKLSPTLNIRPMSIESTHSSNVFNINNRILKLGNSRYNCNINTNFFRIIPCEITYIRDFSGKVCSVVEREYIIDTNPSHIDEYMIYQLMIDFKNNDLCIYDPKCLRLDKSNFGLLKSYKDANLGDYSSHEDLPEYFKENPLVLLDVDLVYRYGEAVDKNVLAFSKKSMDEVIKTYEETFNKTKVKN